ncbi:MAG: UDP-N-acetylmuramoyl-L-alanine--D-glutamate ligase [Clostridia bacterium]|nr:UDP-N-acetylmuramoyl-L-alanine--D-glutamate ligase [Clostridia bacterium]
MRESEILNKIKQVPCTVVGLGVSNLPLIDFLLERGATVTARDQKTQEDLGEIATALAQKGVRLILGEHYLDTIDEGIIFRSPGLRPDLPAFAAALDRGAILTSEMELFLELTPATVIAITGSDGKTTTTTLTGLMLDAECKKRGRGNVFVGGNIGTPLLSRVGEMTEDDFAVLELSSFQLQTVRRSADVAAITNITPNHLNWHTGMEEYIDAKTNIFSHTPCRRLITNSENEVTAALARNTDRPLTLFSSIKHTYEEFDLPQGAQAVYERDGTVRYWNGSRETEIVRVDDVILPGRHNLENYMTAIALTAETVTPETVVEIAKSFTGVEHRLERVRIFDGVTYYNSSIDTSPTRTAAALSALREKPIVICGGYDKHIPFEPLADALCERAKAVILTGATAKKICAVLNARPEVQSGALPVMEEPDFEKAVLLAKKKAQSGDTVLLSPACASFDAFPNFAARGNTFRRIVENFE